ncbi:hypothetical protein FVEN_g4450 [Fusarium venenatum]|uniref:Uncharacterized protein n=1 Tax=Fusarium venenatum TaxID=56646 RepID=A0A2L2T8N8_9HYPO|nr:uncharacterized protein FVRRES_02661 [Fusarium venenatum]KAG8357948.1 hypothetical protein FVEN_g4450 [Fusarium venenatum]KAH7004252.1 hypothetical protein EDB82DRAFT_486408 [Fusarium venenatum]CEI66149.1 unnamed protein product [Fusarium venenatum]
MQPILRAMPVEKIVPLLLTVGSATVVVGGVRTTLKPQTQSRSFDRRLASYSTAQSEKTMTTMIYSTWLED